MALIKNQYAFNSVWENSATYGTNLLTGDDTDFEGGTVGGWTGSASYTPSNTTDQAQAGTHSLKLTSAATGAKTAISPALTVTAGTVYGGYGWVRANTTTRLVQPTISWYSDSGATTLISTTSGATFYVETNTSWLRVQVAGTAPATAIRAKLNIIWANSANPEIHYLDTVFFGTATANTETATTIKVEAHGRGGTGGAGAAGAKGGGGGGGAYARTDAFSVLQGHSHNIVIGSSGSRDSYFSNTGVAPTTTSEGVLAKGGNNGAAGSGVTDGNGGAGGTTAASIGVDAKFAGAAGLQGDRGGGGAGDTAAGSGGTGGATDGGNGGAAGGNPGQSYGGGGGGGAILSGAGGAGGAGIVYITQDTGGDSVTASENFTRTVVFNRSIADSVTASEVASTSLGYIRSVGDSVTTSDAIVKASGKPIADSVTIADANIKTYLKNQADSITTSDAFSKTLVFDRRPTDTATASDSISKNITLTFEDSISGTSPPPTGTIIFAVLD